MARTKKKGRGINNPPLPKTALASTPVNSSSSTSNPAASSSSSSSSVPASTSPSELSFIPLSSSSVSSSSSSSSSLPSSHSFISLSSDQPSSSSSSSTPSDSSSLATSPTEDTDNTLSLDFIPLSSSSTSTSSSSHAETDTFDASSPAPPWLLRARVQSQSLPPLLRLHEECLDLCALLAPTPAEHEMRQDLINRVEAVVKELWEEARLEIFGSFASRLYLPTADIDMVVMDAPGKVEKNLRMLGQALVRKNMVNSLEVIAKARVPIVKFVDRSTGLPVDVSFNISNGVEAVDLIRDFMGALPALRPLTLILKYFLHQRGLNDTYRGGLGSFLLQILVVSFLQHHRSRNSHRHDFKRIGLGHLLVDFFELYGRSFEYEKVSISVRGRGSYFPKSRRDWYDGEKPYLLSVENPQDPTVDVGRNSWAIMRVRKAFEHAHQALTASAHGSILARIIRPTDPLLVNRRRQFDAQADPNASGRNKRKAAPSESTPDVKRPRYAPSSA